MNDKNNFKEINITDYELFVRIKQFPDYFLDGEKSIRRIWSFSGGFGCGLGVNKMHVKDVKFMRNFDAWLWKKFPKAGSTAGWCNAILEAVHHNEIIAYALFFECLDEFYEQYDNKISCSDPPIDIFIKIEDSFKEVSFSHYDILMRMKKHPSMFLGNDLSIRHIRSFLMGLDYGLAVLGMKVKNEKLIKKFDAWVMRKFKKIEIIGWWNAILKETCYNEERAFDLFFKCFDEFQSSQPYHNRTSQP